MTPDAHGPGRGESPGARHLVAAPTEVLMRSSHVLSACAVAGLLAMAPDAAACGCFTPPSASTPVIQAGERILFVARDGQIAAHIQIQYAGQADQFGWLLPLPSIPTLEVGADALFTALQSRTDPTFTTTRTSNCQSSGGGFGCGASASLGAAAACQSDLDCGGAQCVQGICVLVHGGGDLAYDPLVVVDSIGPYDFAVLKADDKTAMLDWLAQNRFFVPAGTDNAVGSYIHPGAYFLALKLRSGKAAGDIQPVVVHYASDLPMIPIVLTSVGATPNMGILVWVLGDARAIPRNYYHSVLNLAAYRWLRASGEDDNYNDLLLRAVREAPGHHTFITEFAGSSGVMKGAIAAPSIHAADLAPLTDPLDYARVIYRAFPMPAGPLLAILQAHIAEPTELVKDGVSPATFYAQLPYWIEKWRASYPAAAPIAFDAQATTGEIAMRVIDPLTNAAALFEQPRYLTRLHTALSPEDMTADPAFSWNASLGDVSSIHTATLNYDCNRNGPLTSPDFAGSVAYSVTGAVSNIDQLPASLRIEMTRESGAPEVVTDNADAIRAQIGGGGGGCSMHPRSGARGILMLIALAALLRRRRKA